MLALLIVFYTAGFRLKSPTRPAAMIMDWSGRAESSSGCGGAPDEFLQKSFVALMCVARHFENVNDLGKFMVIVGLLLAAVGALLWLGFGKGWLGRLPGDIHYSKGDFNFHFPIVTCLVLSAVLTLLLWLFRK